MFKKLVGPVDTYHIMFALILIGLTLFDVFATLRHLERGADEINPLMNALLNKSVFIFLAYKYMMTCFCVFLILSYPSLRLARVGMWIITPVYTILGIYQISLFYIG